MHVLVTRPEPDAAGLKARLEAMGHRVSLAPLLSIEFETREPIRLDAVQALIATSRNALESLARSSSLGEAVALPLFAVGPATAAQARGLGFARVHGGPGSARDLVPLIAANASPADGDLLHIAGDRLAFDLKAALEPRGLTVRHQVVYRSRAAESLEPRVADAIRIGSLGGVIVMSPRTAAIFAALAAKAGVAEASSRLTFFCLSEAVARELAPLMPRTVKLARAPNSEEMLALLARVAPESA